MRLANFCIVLYCIVARQCARSDIHSNPTAGCHHFRLCLLMYFPWCIATAPFAYHQITTYSRSSPSSKLSIPVPNCGVELQAAATIASHNRKRKLTSRWRSESSVTASADRDQRPIDATFSWSLHLHRATHLHRRRKCLITDKCACPLTAWRHYRIQRRAAAVAVTALDQYTQLPAAEVYAFNISNFAQKALIIIVPRIRHIT